jgi:hypothetical protein
MNVSKEHGEHIIHCHICPKYCILRQECYVHGEEIRCLKCDTVLGYTWDIPEVFGEREAD